MITGIISLFLFLVIIIAIIYANRIAVGSVEGSMPNGYRAVKANGHTFSTQISGDSQGVPVILLHGFPESSVMWKRLMSDLNEIGYYTVAPDQRGYSFGARPQEINQYQISHLVNDVIAIADSLGFIKFHLIGHDWGSAVGWQVAANYPARILSYSALSVPHLTAFSRAYREDSLQFKASSYMRDFQTKTIPEFMLAKNKYELLKTIWPQHDEEESSSYIDLFSQQNALTATINWYRANYALISEGADIGSVSVPTLFIWGKNDLAIQRSGIEWTKDYMTGYYRFVELDAGHWLIQESYEMVQQEIMSHLAKFK